MIDKIDGAGFCELIRYGAAAIQSKKQTVNDLNVFPVPDGDTGTNMSLTIATAVNAIRDSKIGTLGEVAAANASALLRVARGNSGVILSLLFRGISRSLKEKEAMDGCDFAAALAEGVSTAYGAVMKPAEGTILTVSRLCAERAAEACRENNCLSYVLEQVIARGKEALADTINQNPVLKKAGVIDAGGKGFLIILEGMYAYLMGEPIADTATQSAQPQKTITEDRAGYYSQCAAEDSKYDYDTVFVIRKSAPDIDLKPFYEYLDGIGDSLVIGDDEDAFKVHVHTDIPGLAITEGQKYGVLEIAKIENMRSQTEALAQGREIPSVDDIEGVEAELAELAAGKKAPEIAPNDNKYGFVAVCAGAGLETVFTDLGVDQIVSGGQTMNPSTEDLLKAVNATPAETVFILPNNKNIIMAAQQCAQLSTAKQVQVVETKTIPQGISAMLSMDPDAEVADLLAAMSEAAGNVHTAQITYAARDSVVDGLEIHANDYLALLDGGLHGTASDLTQLMISLATSIGENGAEFITVFYGADATEEQAEAVGALISDLCPGAEITVMPGGQPVYYYLISIE